MNAPPIEIVLRLATAVLSSISAVLLVASLMRYRRANVSSGTPTSLTRFLAGVMVVTAVWRWFVFWLGFQTDLGEYGHLVQWVQPMNAAMLFLLYLAITLIIYFHTMTRGRVPADAGP